MTCSTSASSFILACFARSTCPACPREDDARALPHCAHEPHFYTASSSLFDRSSCAEKLKKKQILKVIKSEAGSSHFLSPELHIRDSSMVISDSPTSI